MHCIERLQMHTSSSPGEASSDGIQQPKPFAVALATCTRKRRERETQREKPTWPAADRSVSTACDLLVVQHRVNHAIFCRVDVGILPCQRYRKTVFFEPFIYKTEHFTKTGSGQT